MKFYVFFLFLYLIKYITSQQDKNCSDINATNNVCQLSLYDKKDYKYCCLVKYTNFSTNTSNALCITYTQSDYEIQKEYWRNNESIIFECNSSVYLQILIIHILLLIF